MKEYIAPMIFRATFLGLSLVGCLRTLGLFTDTAHRAPLLYYTHLSNYLCLLLMAALLWNTARQAAGKSPLFSPALAARLEFYGVIAILVTFLVANLVLEQCWQATFWTKMYFDNFLMHLLLPALFILDWFLFAPHGGLKWFDPLLCTVFPVVYVSAVLTRGALLKKGSGAVRYPYFFLDADRLGYGGVLLWVAGLLGFFLLLGFLFLLLDRRVLPRR